MRTVHSSTHGKPKQSNYLLSTRSLKKEGVQISVPFSGKLKVSTYDITKFALCEVRR